MYRALDEDSGASQCDLSSVRQCVCAGGMLPAGLLERWQQRYGLSIVEGIGSGELLHIYLSAQPGTQGPRRFLRVPGYELRLVDPRGGEASAGSPGVLWVRGDSLAPCYWKCPDRTARTMQDGWIDSGQRFRRDHDGFYILEGEPHALPW